MLLEADIRELLLPEVHMSFEKFASLQMMSAWTDIVAKAKRLVQSGQVTILRNASQHVMSHVIGDHGEYNCEISRSDPNSQIIEQWMCQCPWAQYAFDRTRKWKKLEGRVCSHVLASYWKAKSVPLDTTDAGSPGDMSPQTPGQRQGPAGPGQQPIPGLPPEHPDMQDTMNDTNFVPHDPNSPNPGAPDYVPPSTSDIVNPAPPQSPFSQVPPPGTPQIEQLHLFDVTLPPGAQGLPPQSPVSIPGGRPPTPTSPVQLPGTFSRYIPVIALRSDEFIHTAADDLTSWFEQNKAAGQPNYVQVLQTVALEQSGGKIPTPGAQPYGVSSEGIPLYRVADLGWHPELGRRMNADEGLQGAPEQQGVYSDVQSGSRGEVLDWDSSLRMAYIFVPLNYPEGQDVRLHPHGMKGWIDYADLKPLPSVKTPPYRVRRR